MARTENHKERMAEALGAFLAAPPPNMPLELLEAFGNMVQTEDGVLPPRVFQEAVMQSPVAISITNTQAKILYANHAFLRMTGYEEHELIGKNQSILSYKVTPIEVYQELWENLLAQKPWNGVLINKRKDGTRYLADLTVAPVLGMEGETSYYLAMHRDVTEVHELEHQVRNQKVLIESVVDMAPVLIALLDIKGEVVLGNQAYQRLSNDLQGEEPAKLILSALSDVMGAEIFIGAGHGHNFLNKEIQIELPHATGANTGSMVGTKWFSCSGIWVDESNIAVDDYFEHKEKECCLLLVANDVTQQKQQQEQVRTNAIRALMAEQQLVHGMRETLSGAVFQLQGPFNMLSAALAILTRRGEDANDPLQTALQEVLNIGETVVGNLNAALPRRTKEAVQPVNLNEVVHEVLSISTERLLAQGVQVDLKLAPALPSVLGHRYELCSLVKQLVDNAIDALGEPGVVRRELLIATQLSDDNVEISVQDTGPGMVDANRFKVFEPFFSGWKQAKSKAGMGLTIALEVAKYHGGSIEIMPQNQYRQGCLIRLLLPLQAPRQLTDEMNK